MVSENNTSVCLSHMQCGLAIPVNVMAVKANLESETPAYATTLLYEIVLNSNPSTSYYKVLKL